MLPRDADQLIVEAVEKHYAEHDSPYYLSELGKFFHSQDIQVPRRVRFKDYLISRFEGRLVVVQDADHPAKIAVAPLDKQALVQQQLSSRLTEPADDREIDQSRLPVALVAAFCKIPLPGTQVYFRVSRPFRYEVGMRAPDDKYIEIEREVRPSSLAGKSVHDLSPSEKQTAYQHIEEWAKTKEIDLRELYYDRGIKSASSATQPSRAGDNALQRLVDAQEPELRERIRIPGDIASTLMRLP